LLLSHLAPQPFCFLALSLLALSLLALSLLALSLLAPCLLAALFLGRSASEPITETAIAVRYGRSLTY